MPSVLNTSLSFGCRENELSQLSTLFALRKHVVITGPAGIGKSALLNQIRSRFPLLLCEDTSNLSRICDGLERQLGWTHPRLNVIERKNRLLSYVEKRGQPIAFDHVSHTPPRIARFMAHLSDNVPVWIVCRSEQPHEIGRVWEYLSAFVRIQISPLTKSETRLLVVQAVMNGAIQAAALEHAAVLHRLSKGNPRLLEELLLELSNRDYRMKTASGQSLLALDRLIQEFETSLSSQATEPPANKAAKVETRQTHLSTS